MSHQFSKGHHPCFLLNRLLSCPVPNMDAETHIQPFFQTEQLLLILPVGRALSLSVSVLTAEQRYLFKAAQLSDMVQVSY